MTANLDLVDAYLDELLEKMRGSGHDVRRTLSEAEDHLREAVDEGLAQGLELEAAQLRAVDRFGSPATVARRFATEEGRLLPPSAMLHVALALGLVAAIGMVAIGVSGLLAAAAGSVVGKRFVAGDAPGVVYTPARCAEFFQLAQGSATCGQAAVAHHFDEVVFYRLDAGILGLVGLAGWWLLRRLFPRMAGVKVLPDSFVPTVGAAMFGAAAVFLLAPSAIQLVFGDSDGVGDFLTGGIVSLMVGAAFCVSLNRTLRNGASLRSSLRRT